MPTETAARIEPVPNATNERAYEAFCEAISSNARGRAFLAEYTRRNRNADTEQLLAAIERLQSLVTAPAPPQTSEAIKKDLRVLLDEIVTTQCDLEARVLQTKAAKLAELLALVERRISTMLDTPCVEPTPEAAVVDVTPTIETPAPSLPQPSGQLAHLAVVPVPEQPELPIPSPASTHPPSISLVRSETIMAEVEFAEPASAPQSVSETVHTPLPEPQLMQPAAETKPAPPADPLASIKALSEEERLALFS